MDVSALHEAKHLTKAVELQGSEPSPLTVRLEPAGTITGRLVDAEGQPWAGVAVTAHLSMSPAELWTLPYEALGRTGLFGGGKNELFTRGTATDADGRFRIAGLLPGLKYELHAQIRGIGKKPDAKPPFAIPRGLTVEAGQGQ